MRKSILAITDFIFLETPLQKADIILIPGGRSRELMIRAAELYHQGYAPLVFPSGGTNKYLPETTEWEHLKNIGIFLGIPEHAILKEDKSRHTFENAAFSLEVIQKNNVNISRAILVCKAFHARRAYLTYKTVFPKEIEFIVSPIHDERNIRKDNWYKRKESVEKVMSEVEKIGKYFSSHINKWI